MGKTEADRIFQKAQKTLDNDQFRNWLCVVYGLMQSRMTPDDLRIIETELNH